MQNHPFGCSRIFVSCQFVLAIAFFHCSMSLAGESVAPVQGPPSPNQPLPPERTAPGVSESSTVLTPVRDWWNDKLSWETGAGRSYVLPAGEILLYEFLLNRFDRNFVEPTSDYETSWDTIWKNLTDSKCVIDNDQFKVNQLL